MKWEAGARIAKSSVFMSVPDQTDLSSMLLVAIDTPSTYNDFTDDEATGYQGVTLGSYSDPDYQVQIYKKSLYGGAPTNAGDWPPYWVRSDGDSPGKFVSAYPGSSGDDIRPSAEFVVLRGEANWTPINDLPEYAMEGGVFITAQQIYPEQIRYVDFTPAADFIFVFSTTGTGVAVSDLSFSWDVQTTVPDSIAAWFEPILVSAFGSLDAFKGLFNAHLIPAVDENGELIDDRFAVYVYYASWHDAVYTLSGGNGGNGEEIKHEFTFTFSTQQDEKTVVLPITVTSGG